MKILLLSDSGMNVNQGGFPQTLYNLFSFTNPADLLFITSTQAYRIAGTSPPFASRTLTYNIESIPVQKNRLGRYINRFIQWVNFSSAKHFKKFKSLQKAIKEFDPDVVVSVPNGETGLFIHYQLKSAFNYKKVFPYFMDDWLCQSSIKWLGGDAHALARKILSENKSWLMISKNLSTILEKRYNVKPTRLLEIQNPVDITAINAVFIPAEKKEYNIAYAGALWPMHFDAFLIIAKAIKRLNNKVHLIVYTAQSNWDWRKNELESINVHYGGYVPYDNIHSKLAGADCLLVTSSFSKEWQTHSKGSVQTKLTDYMKAARLIVSCGPAYAANNDFIKKYDCGVCIETNDEEKAAQEIDAIFNNMAANKKYIINGVEALKKNFSFDMVHQRLKDFLAA